MRAALSKSRRTIRPMIIYLGSYLPVACMGCGSNTSRGPLITNGWVWMKANEAWGSLLTNGEPQRSQCALSGGLRPNLRDRGNFPIEMRSRCLSLCLSRHTDPVSVSSLHPVKPGPPPPPRDGGGTWAPWEGLLSLSSITWPRSAFCGRHCIRYSTASAWSRSKSSQLSHGQMQTRVDKNVMFWWFPL